jgi:predicted MFS family arabinose efflux permease
MRLSPRVFAVGFLQNFASFLTWSVIPVWAKYEKGATTEQLGYLPLAGGVTYIVVCLLAGRLSDRIPRGLLARAGMLLFAAFCGLAWWSRSVTAIACLGALNGCAMALIWPAIQASVGDGSTADDLERNLGAFSFSWSAGKTAGFLAFTALYKTAGLGFDTLLLCGLVGLLLAPLMPSGRGPARAAGAPMVRDDHHPPALRAAHLRAGWWSNFAAYGMGAVLVYLYPALLKSRGREPEDHGRVLGAVYFAQTAGFLLFARFAGWRYRLAPLLAWSGAGAAALVVLGLGAPVALAIPTGIVLGLALSLSYSASVYYSLHSEEKRGARAGIHEAIIGAADCSFAYFGGQAVAVTGSESAPYILAAAATVFAMAMSAWSVRHAPATPTSTTS